MEAFQGPVSLPPRSKPYTHIQRDASAAELLIGASQGTQGLDPKLGRVRASTKTDSASSFTLHRKGNIQSLVA